MKERGGPHLVGQQLAFLSPQDYAKHIEIQQRLPSIPSNAPTANALSSINNALNIAPQQVGSRKKFGSGNGSEQRQLNLAEMVRSSNIIKQPQQPQSQPQLGQQRKDEFIKGTQVQKDFQLVAEPLLPKQPSLQHNNSQNLKQSSTSAASQAVGSEGANSQNSSRKNLESYYTSVASKGGFSDASSQQQQQMMIQNQAIQNLIIQQNQQYSTNRSVAAKAGQMQIFSTDKYSHINSSNSTQNNKFQSPAKPAPGSKVSGHQSSASQQIENMMDLQMMRMKNGNNGGGQNQKYTEYLNRFSTSQSIDQQTQNLQIKYRDLRNQMTTGGDDDKYSYMHAETSSGPEFTPIELVGGPPQFSVQGVSQKRSPLIQKENRVESNNNGHLQLGLQGLGISGDRMHLEEKTFLKKIGALAQTNTSIEDSKTTGGQSYRQSGSSRKRQELSLNARGINRGFKAGVDSQHMALQPRTRYDYVFIRLTEDAFDKEFSSKVLFSRDPNDQSPSALSMKNKRISSMASNNSAIKKDEIAQQTSSLQLTRKQQSLRGSQEYSRENGGLLSPVNQVKIQGGMEELISISNLQAEKQSSKDQVTPKSTSFTANTCSIISTNHTHIKVIAHLGMMNSFFDMTPEQNTLQQIALNECVNDVMSKVQEKGRVVKTTCKKKYIMNALNAAHMRVASIYVIVLDNQASNQYLPDDLRATLLSDSSNTSSNNFNSTLTKFNGARGGLQKQLIKKDSIQKTQEQIANAKNMRLRNNSTINSKGYESENEVKSTNSTTTSSTLQHFIPTRNFDQNGGSATTKNSSRSLSQKGTQPRKNFQKAPQQAVEDPVATIVVQKDGLSKKYPPTKIKIISPFDYVHHEQHRINVCLNNYNNFIQLCFKQKGKINVPAVVKLGKQLGVGVTSNMFTDGIVKSREQANMIKEKLIAYLCKGINEENQPENMPDNQMVQDAIISLTQPVHQYKCFVGKGNNSILIRTLFKTRFWWLLHDKEEIEKVNFMWTQLRKNPIMDALSCKFEDKKSGLRVGGGGNSGSNSVMQTPGKMKAKKKMSMQTSSISLDSSGGTDKKESKTGDVQQQQQVVSQQTSQVNAAMQQLGVKLYNKLEDNFHLSNKKAMFLNIRLYYEAMGKDVFIAVPTTFHVKEGLEDPEFQRFKAYYFKEEEEIKKQKAQRAGGITEGEDGTPIANASTRRNIWIVKPGENTNRGQGITVLKDLDEIKALIQESTANKKRTCIVQKYIHNPLLINKRKFDIRLYAFLSSVNGNIKGYFYQDGYLRTSCREFTLQNLSNRMIHLTNDAVQKNAEDYGKYEAGNKLSYTDFQNYLDKNYSDLNICFERDLLPQMKKLVTDMFRAVYGKIDPKRRINTFEIYGYDFMFDDDFKVYLIEVNTNPCLELGCPLLARLIPTMVENALRLVVDPLFPAPENWSQKKCVVNDICPENKFELIFDDRVDGPYLTELMKEKNNIIIEIDEEELSDNDVDEECEV